MRGRRCPQPPVDLPMRDIPGLSQQALIGRIGDDVGITPVVQRRGPFEQDGCIFRVPRALQKHSGFEIGGGTVWVCDDGSRYTESAPAISPSDTRRAA